MGEKTLFLGQSLSFLSAVEVRSQIHSVLLLLFLFDFFFFSLSLVHNIFISWTLAAVFFSLSLHFVSVIESTLILLRSSASFHRRFLSDTNFDAHYF